MQTTPAQLPVMTQIHFATLAAFVCVVATSLGDALNYPEKNAPTFPRQASAPSVVEAIMLGLSGLPIYKAVGSLLPIRKGKKFIPGKDDDGRVKARSRRDLAYANELLELLESVESALEKQGVTDPQCQLRATCEIHRKNAISIRRNRFEKNFIKLVGEMRREIQNPRIIPLAKYVFEYYEEAAVRGEHQCICKEVYPRCTEYRDIPYKKTKPKRQPKVSIPTRDVTNRFSVRRRRFRS